MSEQNVDCVPHKTSEPENRVGNLDVLPHDASNNGRATVNGIGRTRKGKSPHQILGDLQDGMGNIDEEVSNGRANEEPKLSTESGTKRFSTRNSELRREIVLGLTSRQQYETQHTRMFRNRKSQKKSHVQRSSISRRSVLRSESQEKAKEPVSLAVDGPTKRNRGRKKGKGKGKKDDEYTRIRKKLRYLLNRINYEQSLINAYSSEGWKGLSLEKLRPEKELERATKEILRRKLRIRELFHHLGSLSEEGKLPDSLFDSEGEIDSEDIFCAKCSTKDLSLDNDIILCDGVCDRGFHQYCLQPPLRKEDIPPGDEGWLCPGCDCKVDCIDLLNELLGTKLSINDSWEKIFPEEAAAAAGGDQNLNLGLPSDDSGDDDYDPDGHDDDKNNDHSDDNEEAQTGESSDESDFTSASDEMVGASEVGRDMNLSTDDSEDDDYDPDAPDLGDEMVGASEGGQDMNISTDDSEDDDYDPDAPNLDDKMAGASEGGQDMNLSTDDSEDDDYDPDAPNPDDENEKEESSSSDFTSDSEDVGALLKDNESCQDDEAIAPERSSRENSHLSKEQSFTFSDSNTGNDCVGDVPWRRSIERLNYKKLYDEAYGHVPSSSSDDEDWGKTARTRGDDSDSEDKITNMNEGDTGPSKQSSQTNHTRKRKEKSKRVENSDTLIAPQEGDKENGSLGQESRSSSNRKHRTQRLSKAFQENRYPDAATKESLAAELQMTLTQVNNWFRNRRSSTNATLFKMVSKEDAAKSTTSKEGPGESSLMGSTQRATKPETSNDKKAPRSQKKRRN